MKTIDLNCDFGESFGAYQLGVSEDILNYVTSVNIACGYHAGDPKTMREACEQAVRSGVRIGAHPGFPDLNGFGRRNMALTPQEIYDIVLYQLGALEAFVRISGGTLNHVKPHGALYNMAAKDSQLAHAIACAVEAFDPELILYGLSGSALIQAGTQLGLPVAHEVFADRTYQEDGTLTSRNHPNALLTNDQAAVEQVIRMVRVGKVTSLQKRDVSIQADTVCLHGDGAHALEFAKTIRQGLLKAKIEVQSIGRSGGKTTQ